MRRRLVSSSSRWGLALALALTGLLGAACGSTPTREVVADDGKDSTALPSDAGTVDLRIYLRAGSGSEAYLAPVTRRSTINEDLPRRALELLIAGPEQGDGKDLHATLPASTTVLNFAVEGDTAVVDLSREAIGDAATVEPSPEHELLALSAVANTLTEFPLIDRVRLTIAGGGQQFWGGWGVPEWLARDERVIGPRSKGDGLPAMENFGRQAQQVGSEHAGPVAVLGVRTIDRVGFLRVVVDLGDPGTDESARGIPPVSAAIEQGRLVLRISDVAENRAELIPGRSLDLGYRPFESLEAEPSALPGPLSIAVMPAGNRPFWLHTLNSPTRVVLDVRK